MINRPDAITAAKPLLKVDDLRVAVGTRKNPRFILDTASLEVDEGDTVGVVGESGSGKTMLCRTLIGTLGRQRAWISGGSIKFEGRELVAASEATWRELRGRRISYIPQASMIGLNPVLTVGEQLRDVLRARGSIPANQAEEHALALLEDVRMSDPQRVMSLRPNELSGGMRQRVMIAAALCENPHLLIADEPTTALDVTVQREILDLILSLQRQRRMSLILVSHDLAVIEDVCRSVTVMYAGATVEVGELAAVVARPRHPYTRGLMQSRIDRAIRGQPLAVIEGDVPSVGAWPPGCRFHPRCPLAEAQCRVGMQPPSVAIGGRSTACLLYDRM